MEKGKDENEGKFLVVGTHNIAEIFEGLRNAMRESDRRAVFAAIESGDLRMRKCRECGAGMLTQPPAMTIGENGMEYFCEEHAPGLF